MNEYLQNRTLQIIESLIDWSVCSQFNSAAVSQDPTPFDLFIVPDKKFDLNSIKTKCEGKEYKSLKEFKDDVNLVLTGGMEGRPKDNFQCILAQEAAFWFNNKVDNLPHNPEQEWRVKIAKQVAKIDELLKFNPLNNQPTTKQIREAFAKLPQ